MDIALQSVAGRSALKQIYALALPACSYMSVLGLRFNKPTLLRMTRICRLQNPVKTMKCFIITGYQARLLTASEQHAIGPNTTPQTSKLSGKSIREGAHGREHLNNLSDSILLIHDPMDHIAVQGAPQRWCNFLSQPLAWLECARMDLGPYLVIFRHPPERCRYQPQ